MSGDTARILRKQIFGLEEKEGDGGAKPHCCEKSLEDACGGFTLHQALPIGVQYESGSIDATRHVMVSEGDVVVLRVEVAVDATGVLGHYRSAI